VCYYQGCGSESRILAQSGSGFAKSLRIRIQCEFGSGSNANPDPQQNLWRQNFFKFKNKYKLKKINAGTGTVLFKNYYLVRYLLCIKWQKMHFLNSFFTPGSGSTKSFNTDQIRIHNPGYYRVMRKNPEMKDHIFFPCLTVFTNLLLHLKSCVTGTWPVSTG
jgi:hypothetical protein